jgi:hypothetical protein
MMIDKVKARGMTTLFVGAACRRAGMFPGGQGETGGGDCFRRKAPARNDATGALRHGAGAWWCYV